MSEFHQEVAMREWIESVGNQKLKDADNLCKKVKEAELFFKKYAFQTLYIEIPEGNWICWDESKKRIILKLYNKEKPFVEHKMKDRLNHKIYFEDLIDYLLKENGRSGEE